MPESSPRSSLPGPPEQTDACEYCGCPTEEWDGHACDEYALRRAEAAEAALAAAEQQRDELMQALDRTGNAAITADAELYSTRMERDAALERAKKAESNVRAAADILAAAEKIVPGVIQTAGRFAIGDVAEARAERDAALERCRTLETALQAALDCTGHWGAGRTEPAICRECQRVARAALASGGETTGDSEAGRSAERLSGGSGEG